VPPEGRDRQMVADHPGSRSEAAIVRGTLAALPTR
jgi:hypothetical protein